MAVNPISNDAAGAQALQAALQKSTNDNSRDNAKAGGVSVQNQASDGDKNDVVVKLSAQALAAGNAADDNNKVAPSFTGQPPATVQKRIDKFV